MKKYFLDLFSGIGGFALGADWAGLRFDGHFFSEVDKMPFQFIKKDFPHPSVLATAGKSTTQNCQKEASLFQEGSPASRTALPEKERQPGTSAIFGANVTECLGFYDRKQHCLKMFRDYLRQKKGSSSKEFYATLPKAGMMRNGVLYQLGTLAPCIYENGSGSPVINQPASWPTPRNNSGPSKDKRHLSLDGAVALWGTPTANDAKNSLSESQRGRGTLTASVVENLWPTMSSGKICGGSGAYKKLKEKCDSVEQAKQMGNGRGNKLNSDWVEALMGYPDGWTDITRSDICSPPPYPQMWIDGTWEEGIPRVTAKTDNRITRLKCLGNAIVPQVAKKIWMFIGRFYGEAQV